MAKPPSSALLSILAILATANGSPTPPAFLCPSTTTTPSSSPAAPRRIPSKFVRRHDGLWIRVESYTLYGLTVPCTGECLYPTHVISSDDDQLQVEPSNSTPAEDIRDSLPLGWKPMPKPSESRTTLILALSLILALFICFFIIGCVFWRKNTIKRRRRDLEADFKKHESPPSTAESKDLAGKEGRAKQKILARATARWKANVRHAARQRKGKRVAASKSSQAHQSSHSLNSSRNRLAISVSLPSSRASSRRSSLDSLPDDLPRPIIAESLLPISPSHGTISTMTTSPDTISPPAYHHGSQASPTIYSNISHVTPLDRPRRPSQSSSFSVRINSRTSELSTPRPFHTAHVATDDKALLARLADLASRPPEDAPMDTIDTCDAHVSAPAWHDEPEEIPPDLITSNDHPPGITCPPSSLFPPPPSKERMATTDLYDYSFSFQDMATLEPEHEPSAPPFQLDPAALVDDHQMIPSAPPLLDDFDLIVDVHPTPLRESTSCQLDVVGEEDSAGQDHDRITSAEVVLTRLPSSVNVQPIPASRRDIDGITLPGYRP